jgi:hypothetical protein
MIVSRLRDLYLCGKNGFGRFCVDSRMQVHTPLPKESPTLIYSYREDHDG